jgi:hypothetical protein
MSSGPGVPKPRRENESGRMVPKERWSPISAGSQIGPMGQVLARNERPDRDISMAAWQGPSGHHAEVEQELGTRYGSYRGIEHNRYVAGPFRTPVRAQVAAESLANRVESGAGHERYENDSWTEYRR